ncbi:polysaccharide biosynthesis protein [Christensenellaceae bacterium OttesenSCG-928-K19]|nr:polysaccharide biosynthesis protein [Christensenellaceae bacterium OttesenSCG-928-K19]
MTQTQKNFVKGAAVLGIAGLIVKIIGALFRIPLANVVGTEGMGYYQMAYPVYTLLLTVSTAGLPTAISKLVSERIAHGDYAGAHYTFQVARRVLLLIGIVTAILMFALARPISNLQATPPAMYSLMAISPALFFVSVMSAYRGYFQGMQNMTPTALSQLVEQAGKLVIGLSLAYVMLERTGNPAFGAMGALIGVTIAEAVALFYMIGVYGRRKNEILANIPQLDKDGAKKNFRPIVKQVLLIAIPVTLGACVMPIVSALDSVIVSRTLQDIGYAQKEATSMYGVLTGVVNPLINMPAVLSLALAMSLVPAISQSSAQGDTANVKAKSSFGFKLALLVGLPCATGFMLLAQPIIMMLYKNVQGSELAMAVMLFQMLSFGVLFLTLVQTMTGILQGLGKPVLPVISLAVGATAKVVVSILLIRVPDINIYGAAAGTICCYAIAAVMDIIFVVRRSGFSISIVNHIIKPVLATVVMGVCVYAAYRLVGGYSNTAGVLAAILVGIVVYAGVLLLTRGLTQLELDMLPGGGRLAKVMKKMRIWK